MSLFRQIADACVMHAMPGLVAAPCPGLETEHPPLVTFELGGPFAEVLGLSTEPAAVVAPVTDPHVVEEKTQAPAAAEAERGRVDRGRHGRQQKRR